MSIAFHQSLIDSGWSTRSGAHYTRDLASGRQVWCWRGEGDLWLWAVYASSMSRFSSWDFETHITVQGTPTEEKEDAFAACLIWLWIAGEI